MEQTMRVGKYLQFRGKSSKGKPLRQECAWLDGTQQGSHEVGKAEGE